MTIHRTLLLRSFVQFVLERLTDLPNHDYTASGLFAIGCTLFLSEAALWDMAQQLIEMLLGDTSKPATQEGYQVG